MFVCWYSSGRKIDGCRLSKLWFAGSLIVTVPFALTYSSVKRWMYIRYRASLVWRQTCSMPRRTMPWLYSHPGSWPAMLLGSGQRVITAFAKRTASEFDASIPPLPAAPPPVPAVPPVPPRPAAPPVPPVPPRPAAPVVPPRPAAPVVPAEPVVPAPPVVPALPVVPAAPVVPAEPVVPPPPVVPALPASPAAPVPIVPAP